MDLSFQTNKAESGLLTWVEYLLVWTASVESFSICRLREGGLQGNNNMEQHIRKGPLLHIVNIYVSCKANISSSKQPEPYIRLFSARILSNFLLYFRVFFNSSGMGLYQDKEKWQLRLQRLIATEHRKIIEMTRLGICRHRFYRILFWWLW